MQVPPLVKSIAQRMQVVLEPKSPGAVHRRAILLELSRRERLPLARAMRADGQDVRRAIGKVEAGPRSRNEHDLPREIAGRLPHRLMRGRDAARGRVIVDAEMNAVATAFRGIDQRAEADLSLTIDD